LLRHEFLAGHQSEKSINCFGALGMAGEKAVWLAPHFDSSRLAGHGVSFHDGEEIGPRMLARIAKVSGLKPEDL
jgi:hypothetical protein